MNDYIKREDALKIIKDAWMLHPSGDDAIQEAIDCISLLPAADAIEELSKPKWIPVTERSPQEWWPVLGLIQFHDDKEPPAQEVLWYLGNGHWRETWRGDMIESAVTHWMPLPEPPKDET